MPKMKKVNRGTVRIPSGGLKCPSLTRGGFYLRRHFLSAFIRTLVPLDAIEKFLR